MMTKKFISLCFKTCQKNAKFLFPILWIVYFKYVQQFFLLVFFQSISGVNDIEQLSHYFAKQEDENFALFSYVNELSYEVEVLNETVQKIRDDIGRFWIMPLFDEIVLIFTLETNKQFRMKNSMK